MEIEGIEHITTQRIGLAQAALDRLGWSLQVCDIDLVAQTLRLELMCGDLSLLLDARGGRVVVEREIVRRVQPQNVRHTHGQIWRRELLGRTRPIGLRHGLLQVARYIQDCGAERIEARRAVALLLRGG
jgi:hypothetical protein